jgi:phosphoribosylanthranilate isomerase
MSAQVKICGLTTPDAVRAASRAEYAGFVFYRPSPRDLSPQQASALVIDLPPAVRRVALVVDADDTTLATLLRGFAADILQLHGGETPARVAEIRGRFGLPVMKVVAVREARDVESAAPYYAVADRLLFDARPPERPGALPGGNAERFDWRLLAGRSFPLPWMLSGGLTPENVAEAIAVSSAPAVDVSSGVEAKPGLKDPVKIAAFIAAARGNN